jgi:hypothetical protein
MLPQPPGCPNTLIHQLEALYERCSKVTLTGKLNMGNHFDVYAIENQYKHEKYE